MPKAIYAKQKKIKPNETLSISDDNNTFGGKIFFFPKK